MLNIKKEEEFITEMPEETEGTKEDIQEEVAIPTQEESKISLEKVSQAVPEVEHPSELIRSEKDLHNTEPFEKENDNIKNTDNLSHDNIQYVIKEVPSHKEKPMEVNRTYAFYSHINGTKLFCRIFPRFLSLRTHILTNSHTKKNHTICRKKIGTRHQYN